MGSTNLLAASLLIQKSKFHVYRAVNKEWRWRLKASNGKIIADGAEGYVTKQGCLDGIAIVKQCGLSEVVED